MSDNTTLLETIEDLTFASIDLGSNSFHMIIGRQENGQLVVVDRMREAVRLSEGLVKKDLLPHVQDRAIECLARFGQRLAGIPAHQVRVVGTNTLRQLPPDHKFFTRATEALGYKIDVISGSEEARLVYLGVAHGLASEEKRRLVVDIGGGSTEVILGKNKTAGQRDSLNMGCVTITQTFFGSGEITEQRMNSAILRGALEIRAVRESYQPGNWDMAIGSSGTIKAILKVMNAMGCDGEVITANCLKKLRKRMIKIGSIDALDFEGLSDERRPVFVGGVAVLSAVFNSLGIEELHVSSFALREGLLYELIGEISRTDVRETTIESLQQRFAVDVAHAKQVTNLAMRLFSQIASDWKLDERQDAKLLRWAAATHEIGLSLSHNSFHKHSAYILSNADLTGFTNQQKQQLSTIVRFQRRKISSTAIKELPKYHRDSTKKLILLLRLAIILHRSRTPDTKIEVDIKKIDKENISLTFPKNWLSEHPLNEAELNSEISAWEKLNFTLSIS